MPIAFFLLVYALVRIFDKDWKFLGFSFCQSLAYLDILFLLFGFYLIFDVSLKDKTIKIRAPHNALQNDGVDELKFKGFAKELAAFIESYRYTDSFTIGVEGPWGYGKTSFFILVKNHLDLKKFAIIDFSAFDDVLLNNNQSFLLRFEESLYKEFKDSSSLKRDLKKYMNLITSYNQNNSMFFSKVSDIFINDDFHSVKSRINHSIAQSGKKIIVVVDDTLCNPFSISY